MKKNKNNYSKFKTNIIDEKNIPKKESLYFFFSLNKKFIKSDC